MQLTDGTVARISLELMSVKSRKLLLYSGTGRKKKVRCIWKSLSLLIKVTEVFSRV